MSFAISLGYFFNSTFDTPPPREVKVNLTKSFSNVAVSSGTVSGCGATTGALVWIGEGVTVAFVPDGALVPGIGAFVPGDGALVPGEFVRVEGVVPLASGANGLGGGLNFCCKIGAANNNSTDTTRMIFPVRSIYEIFCSGTGTGSCPHSPQG